MLQIDGKMGEGGGQVLRSCLSLSIITKRPFAICNIRAGRPRPGLMPQHLSSVRAAVAISRASVTGAEIGSANLTFSPKSVRAGRYRFDIGTAGSISLVFQTIFLPLALAGAMSEIELIGGTHVPWSPCFHYLKEVFAPAVEVMGYRCKFNLEKWGFYPKGQGIMKALIEPPKDFHPFLFKDPGSCELFGISSSARLPEHVRIRQAKSALKFLHRRGLDANILVVPANASCPGSIMFLWTKGGGKFGGFTSFGKKAKPAEEVGREAAKALLSFLESGASCDEHLSDQLILPAALTGATSLWTTNKETSHFKTNALVAEKFLDCTIKTKKLNDGRHLIELYGVRASSFWRS